MGTSHNLIPHGESNVVLKRLSPEGGFELYRDKNAGQMRTGRFPLG